MNEDKDIRKPIELFLESHDIYYIHLENSPRGKYRNSNTKKFKGFPDHEIFLKNGHILFFEYKTPTGRLNSDQVKWKTYLESMGAHYFIIRSMQEGLKVIQKYMEASK
jgi:hypothetical protein